MGIKYKNYAEGTLTANLGAAAVDTMVLSSNDGLKFPVIVNASGDYFYATLVDVSGNREIIKVTEHQNGTDVFQTFVRAQDDTVGIAFAIGDKVQLRIPKVVIEELQDGIDANLAAAALNTTHRGSDGTNHANVVLNDTHRASDGKSHSDVVLNNTHRASNGTSHANVVLNDSHRGGDGSDHADVATNSAARHAQSHTVASHSDTTATGAELESLTDGSDGSALHKHNSLYDDGELGVVYTKDAAAVLNFNGLPKFQTNANGVAVIGELTASGKMVARDHAGGSTPELGNVIFGTGSPPTASNTPIGTLFIKYQA